MCTTLQIKRVTYIHFIISTISSQRGKAVIVCYCMQLVVHGTKCPVPTGGAVYWYKHGSILEKVDLESSWSDYRLYFTP